MSTLSQLPEDIRHEFEVKEDGRVVCKSWRALARLCGVSPSVFADDRPGRFLARIASARLESGVIADSLPKTLEPLAGLDLKVFAEIDEVTLSCIINYFAWESDSSTGQAKSVALAMTSIGLRAFFQKELGWQPPKPMTYLQTLKQLVELEEHKERVKAGYPGLESTYDSAGQKDTLKETGLGRTFSLKEWISFKGLNLGHSERISLGNFLASTVERDTTTKLVRHKGGTTRYSHSHLPLLDEGLNAWQQRGGLL